MAEFRKPRLRTAEKVSPPFPLNKFPPEFAYKLGREIVYVLATKPNTSIEGPEWEEIFARSIGAQWKPSNVGLDDIVLGVCAWGAKTVKNKHPHDAKNLRLISGRNSPAYSFAEMALDGDPQSLGNSALRIWNARVESVRAKFSHLRTVVLIKSEDLTNLTVFETDTVMYPIDNYIWTRNERGNLEGHHVLSGEHKFTWQPHGSQFTIFEDVPSETLMLKIKSPKRLDRNKVLDQIGFNKSWIEIIKK